MKRREGRGKEGEGGKRQSMEGEGRGRERKGREGKEGLERGRERVIPVLFFPPLQALLLQKQMKHRGQ